MVTKKVISIGAVFAVAVISWSIFAYDQSGKTYAGSCANPSPTIIPAKWATEYSQEDGLYYEALFSVTARTKILTAAGSPVPLFTAGGLKKQLRNLTEGSLFIDKRGPLQKLGKIEWSTAEYGQFYSTQLHGLVGIGTLLKNQQELTATAEQAVGDHITNWALCALTNPTINERAFYEGTVIKRLSNLLGALNYMRLYGQLGDLTYRQLIYLIDKDVNFLLDTENVYSFDNHGIRQDSLLAATALALPSHPRSGEMLQLAKSRLNKAADILFTKRGIWKEHAPGYVNYILLLMLDVEKLSKTKIFRPQKFLDRFDTSLKYLIQSLLPNTLIPHVGQSGAQRVSRVRTY